jgi:hypothetical protein
MFSTTRGSRWSGHFAIGRSSLELGSNVAQYFNHSSSVDIEFFMLTPNCYAPLYLRSECAARALV